MTMQVIDLSDDLEANTFETSEHHSDKTNFDKTQWEALKNRILEKMASSGITLLQIAIETMPKMTEQGEIIILLKLGKPA